MNEHLAMSAREDLAVFTDQIVNYFKARFGRDLADFPDINEDTDLFLVELLDSLSLVEMILHLEQLTGRSFPVERIDPESFRTIRKQFEVLNSEQSDLTLKTSIVSIEDYRTEFEAFGTSQLYDASSQHCQVVNLGVVPRGLNRKVAGPVYPLTTDGEILPCLAELDHVEPGWVYLICDTANTKKALAGDIVFTAAQYQKIGGMVVLGAVRDIEFITQNSTFPVFSSHVNMVAAKNVENRDFERQHQIDVDSVTIRTGQWLFGDDDGFLIIDETYLPVVFQSARALAQKEKRLRNRLRSERFSDVVGMEQYLNGDGVLNFDG